MKRFYTYYLLIVIAGIVVSCGKDSVVSPEKTKEVSVTGAATDITEFKATLTGYANLTPDMGAVTMGIIYSTEENPTLDNGVELKSYELDENNKYCVCATALDYGTTYYYRAFVEYGGVYRYGKTRQFVTRAFKVSVTTADAINLAGGAVFNGSFYIESIEKINVYEVGFNYGTDAEDCLIVADSSMSAEYDSDGLFSASIFLAEVPATIYYVAYVVIPASCDGDYSVYYGDVKSVSISWYRPETTQRLKVQKDWGVEYLSGGTDKNGAFVRLRVSSYGSNNVGLTVLTDADYVNQYDSSPNKVIEAFAAAPKKALAGAMACTMWEDEKIYLDTIKFGPASCWLIDFDDAGFLTGKYAQVPIDIAKIVPGKIISDPLFQSNWNVTKVGIPYSVYFSNPPMRIVDIEVDVPGATYFWCKCYTDAEFTLFYPGGIEEMLLEASSKVMINLASDTGKRMSELCFTPDDDGLWIYYPVGGETKVYIIEFNSTGAATGKYGVTAISIPFK